MILEIDILLSTYNGGAYLEELLRSLCDQSFSGWRLIVRDDGSVDNTLEILHSFREKEKDKTWILEDDHRHLGPKESFEVLLHASTANYIMFCDQDDVWMKDKIQRTFDKMKELEQEEVKIPVLVFSDLTVADENLNVIHPSLWKYTKVNPRNINNVYRLLINNPVVGCTVMINKAMKSFALPIPQNALMHDWWIALKIAGKGRVGYLEKSTIWYRLHGQNNVGASAANKKYFLKRALRLSTTFSQNIQAIKMLNSLDPSLSVIKFLRYKFAISFSKIFGS